MPWRNANALAWLNEKKQILLTHSMALDGKDMQWKGLSEHSKNDPLNDE